MFFVISGFAITELLLRQQARRSVEYLSFYARRARRFPPMALVVIVVATIAMSVVASRSLVVEAASDGRWRAVFLANCHFLK